MIAELLLICCSGRLCLSKVPFLYSIIHLVIGYFHTLLMLINVINVTDLLPNMQNAPPAVFFFLVPSCLRYAVAINLKMR